MENLLTNAISLTLFGMIFVFIFLALMVFLTFFMSKLVQKIKPELAVAGLDTANTNTNNKIDKNTKLIIEKVIRKHIGD